MTWLTGARPVGRLNREQIIAHDRHNGSLGDEIDNLIELAGWKLVGHLTIRL